MKSKLRNFFRSRNQKTPNTTNKTKNDLKAWKKLCEFLKESRAIENIPANELDLLLSKFFISVRKQNGTEYAFAAAKLDDTNKKKVSNHSVRKTSVGRLLEADVQPNFVAQLSGHKKFEKPRQLPFSISEATARNACYPES